MVFRFYIMLGIFLLNQTQNFAQWQLLPGINGGDVICWTASPNGGIWIGGTAGVFHSVDDGRTWQLLPSTKDLGGYPIQLDWDNGNLYLVCQNIFSWDRSLFKSNDSGITWLNILDNVVDKMGNMGIFDVWQDTIVVNTPTGHISLDGGMNWQTSPTSYTWNIIRTKQGWFNSYYNTVYRWTGAWAWEVSYQGLDKFTSPRRILEAGDFVFVFFETPFAQYLYKRAGDNDWKYGGLPIIYNHNEVSVAERNDTIFMQCSDTILFSTDGLQSWQKRPANGLSNYSIKTCLFTSSGAIIALTNNGVFRSENIDSEFLPTEGFSSQNTLSVFNEGDESWWVGTNYGLFHSKNNGLTWEKKFPNLTNSNSEITWIKKSGNNILAGNQQGFFYSPTHGDHWIKYVFPSSDINYDVSIVGNSLFYGSSGGSYLSEDWGAKWSAFSPRKDGNPIIVRSIAEKDSLIAIAGYWSDVYLSRDYGNTWIDFSQGLDASSFIHIANEIAIGDNEMVFISGSRMMRTSLDSANWKEVSSAPGNRGTFFFSGGKIHLGIKNSGIYVSNDSAKTWALATPIDLYTQTNNYYFSDSLTSLATYNGIWYNGTISSELVGGYVYSDLNQDSSFNQNDIPLSGRMIELKNSKIYTFTNEEGRYAFDWKGKEDTLRLIPLGVNETEKFKVSKSSGLIYDFPIQSKDKLSDITLDLANASLPRPGFNFDIYATCRNEGTVATSFVLRFFKASNTSWVNFSSSPLQLINDTAFFYVANLQPGANQKIIMTLRLDQQAIIGSIVPINGKANPENVIDINGKNNLSHLFLKVVGSYDPNDKAVFPEGAVTTEMVADTQRMTYTVRFQNTGSFPAEFIRIKDKMSPNLDLGSFRIESSSHPMKWTIEGRTIEFYFPDIQLPDSTSNESGSHGFVKYSINLNTNLKLQDSVENFADIYFDFNTPIRTNTTLTKIDVKVSSNSIIPSFSCQVSPNPTHSNLTIGWDYFNNDLAKLYIYDLNGKLLMSQESYIPSIIKIDELLAGTYIILIKVGDGFGRASFVKTNH